MNIPPILFNDVFTTYIQEEEKMFNDFFAQQCTPLDGDDLPVFTSKTNKVLSDAPFDESDIKSILKHLKPNKAHGWDDISICLIQLCGDSIVAPLFIIYKNCLSCGAFPSSW